MRKHLIAWIISTVLCLCMIPIKASAYMLPAGVPEWDTSVKGSITARLVDAETRKPLAGGALTIYRFAEVTGSGVSAEFVLSDDYSSLKLDLTAPETYTGESAAEIWYFIQNHNLKDSGTEAAVDKAGTAVWTGLDQGLYLVVQTTLTRGYMPISPYIVSLPHQTDEGEFIYDVVSVPKSAVYTSVEPVVVKNPPVKKVVESDDALPEDSIFRFRFRPVGKSCPMPVNDYASVEAGGPVVSRSDEELVLQIRGEGELEVGEITFYQEGQYFYEVSEVDMQAEGFEYDDTVYRYEFDIVETENKLVCSRLLIRLGDADGEIWYDSNLDSGDGAAVEFTFKNSYDEPEESVPDKPEPEEPVIVHTGQLWWPVPVLFLAGAALVLAGIRIRRAGGRNES